MAGTKGADVDLQTLGRLLLVLAVGLALLGGLMLLGARLGLGSLPGDLRIQVRGFSCFLPIMTSVVLSLLLTLLLNICFRLFR